MEKLLKQESKVFEGKDFLIFISLPLKYSKDKRVDRLKKKYKSQPFVFVFSKDLKKHAVYHSFFNPTAFVLGTWALDLQLVNNELTTMFIELNKILGLYKEKIIKRSCKNLNSL